MKKFLITVLAAMFAGGVVSANGHVAFPDIPAGHWAADAVDEIADLGIVIGFPDGTYRGNEAFTRYQAALVVARLLAVIEARMEAELGTLRAGMQGMAADLAAQGTRLGAAESAIAALNGGVGANAARLDAVEAALAALPAGVDEAIVRDLQNQAASARVAVDTAQAQAAAADARAQGAYDMALQALAASDANAAELAALTQVVQLLQSQVDGLSAPVAPAAAPDLSGIERNAGDIANIRDFVILLRRDQVALRDRVTALEGGATATNEAVAALDARVAALEAKPSLDVSGTIALNYSVGRVDGDYQFDVDRLFGVGAKRSMSASAFSTGTADSDADGTAGNDVGERAQDRADTFRQNGDVSANLTLNITTGRTLAGKGSPRGLNDFAAVAVVDIVRTTTPLNDTSGNPISRPYVFRVKSFTTSFDPIGAAPLTFAFGESLGVAFSDYVFNRNATANKRDGYIARVSAPDFLAFLDPKLTIAYFTDAAGGYMRGIHGEMAPSLGSAITLSGGVSYAEYTETAADYEDVDADNAANTRTVMGVDGNVGLLGLVDVAFEYGSSADAGTATGSILWVTAKVDGADLPILSSLAGNYRAVEAGFDGLGEAGNEPFTLGQSGFGVEAGLDLFIVDVTGFFDSFTLESTGDAHVGYGAKVAADLFVGFSLSGYYETATVNGTTVASNVPAAIVTGLGMIDGRYEHKFGVELKHDGKAENALISGLNIAAGYQASGLGYDQTLIYADADLDLTVSVIRVTPYVGYRMFANTTTPAQDYNELTAGTGLSVPLDVALKPTLDGAVNYRQTNWTGADYTATEFQWSVGLTLGEFLFPNSSVSAKVGSWTGTNTTQATNSVGAGDGATDISRGRAGDTDSNDQTEAVFGWEVAWDYYDLRFAYGMYDSTREWGTDSSAQSFSIKYSVAF